MTHGDRSEGWLALLRRCGRASPRWAAHGDLDEGFAAEGDVDLIAPEADLGRVRDLFTEWASECGLGPVVACRHRDGVLIMVALGAPGEVMFELEVRFERFFKGATLWRAEDLEPFFVDDDRLGIRRVRDGAAGLLKLVPNGLGRAGRSKWDRAKRDRVALRLRADPAGVEAAAALFGAARPAARAAARAVAAGRWDRGAALRLEAWAALHGVRGGLSAARRAAARARGGRRCSVLEAVAAGRVVADPGRWARAARRDHDVVLVGPGGHDAPARPEDQLGTEAATFE
jgi:hypothetical protein